MISELYRIHPAFFKWFLDAYRENIEDGAEYLLGCVANGTSDNIVWDLLKATEDTMYNRATFAKAAMMVVEEAKRNNHFL